MLPEPKPFWGQLLAPIPRLQSPMIFTTYATLTNNRFMIHLLLISIRYLRQHNINTDVQLVLISLNSGLIKPKGLHRVANGNGSNGAGEKELAPSH